ncbi:ABC transporter substrate-binding protein [Massiliimalia massiliensis]|uniref:ABC transporter substrate-binding protein n=1 Tax=Massiliimalia massiliensis TaxID=1852384 RepID=UPI0009878386|nr:extracellular solute-binding protein [Massiliimalia massiliensis]
MKNPSLKKAIAVMVIAMQVMTMSACGEAANSSSGSTADSGKSGTAGEIEIYICNDDDLPQLAIDKIKTDNPGLEVVYDQASADKYETLLKTRLSAGDAPDIMTVWPGSRTSDYAQKGYLEPLNDCTFVDRIPETINSEFSWDGDLYALCNGISAEGLFVNKGILADNGLEVPTDYEQFKNVCKTLQDNGVQPLASGYKEDWVIMRYTNSAFPSLGYAVNPNFDADLDSGKVDFSFEGWRETFDRFGELLDAGYFGENLLSTDSSQAIAQFATGQTAMLIHTIDNVKQVRETSPDMNLIFTALPVNDPGEERFACSKSSTGYSVSSKSDNKEAAIAFLEAWCDNEINQKIYTEKGMASPLTDVAVSTVDQTIIDFQDEFVKTGKFALGAHDRWPAGMSNNWKKKLQEFVGREITTDEMIEWLNNEYASLSGK